jgi:hypothetical protein
VTDIRFFDLNVTVDNKKHEYKFKYYKKPNGAWHLECKDPEGKNHIIPLVQSDFPVALKNNMFTATMEAYAAIFAHSREVAKLRED